MACLHGLPRTAGDRSQYSPSESVQPEPAMSRRARILTGYLRLDRTSTRVAAQVPSGAERVFSQVVPGDEGLLETADSGESVAEFDGMSVNGVQRGCCLR